MSHTACTEPQCLYKGALYTLPARTRGHVCHTSTINIQVLNCFTLWIHLLSIYTVRYCSKYPSRCSRSYVHSLSNKTYIRPVQNLSACTLYTLHFTRQNTWTRLPHVYNQYSSPLLLHTLNTFPEHIYCSVLFEISITLFKILRAFRIKQNVHKSVWKLARLEWSDVAKTDWWLHFVTDSEECIETFKFRFNFITNLMHLFN